MSVHMEQFEALSSLELGPIQSRQTGDCPMEGHQVDPTQAWINRMDKKWLESWVCLAPRKD